MTKSRFKAGQKVKFPLTKDGKSSQQYQYFLDEVEENNYTKDYFIISGESSQADNVWFSI